MKTWAKTFQCFQHEVFHTKMVQDMKSIGKLITVKKKKKKAQEARQLNIYSHKIPKQVASTS